MYVKPGSIVMGLTLKRGFKKTASFLLAPAKIPDSQNLERGSWKMEVTIILYYKIKTKRTN